MTTRSCDSLSIMISNSADHDLIDHRVLRKTRRVTYKKGRSSDWLFFFFIIISALFPSSRRFQSKLKISKLVFVVCLHLFRHTTVKVFLRGYHASKTGKHIPGFCQVPASILQIFLKVWNVFKVEQSASSNRRFPRPHFSFLSSCIASCGPLFGVLSVIIEIRIWNIFSYRERAAIIYIEMFRHHVVPHDLVG